VNTLGSLDFSSLKTSVSRVRNTNNAQIFENLKILDRHVSWYQDNCLMKTIFFKEKSRSFVPLNCFSAHQMELNLLIHLYTAESLVRKKNSEIVWKEIPKTDKNS
jgi:hypothetical protein